MPLDLNRLFLKEGNELNFFQAVYLLEKLYLANGRIGTGDDMKSEPVRFETMNSLGFPPGELSGVLPPQSFRSQAEELENPLHKESNAPPAEKMPPLKELVQLGDGPLRMVLTFMGLYGVSSPLPSYFVDPITLKKIEYFELKKFLDIFSHRLYSLFYRSWKKYRHQVQFNPNGPDDYTLRLLALTGQWPRRKTKADALAGATGTGAIPRAPGSVNDGNGTQFGQLASTAGNATSFGLGGSPAGLAGFDLRRIPYARFLGNRVRSAKGLQQLLRGYFGFPKVRIVQFESAWVDIPVPTRLGEGLVALGVSTRLGERMQDRLSRFTVEIGPMPCALFNSFLPLPDRHRNDKGPTPDPASELLQAVRNLVEAYLRDPLDYQIKVILEPDPAHAPVLGSADARMGMGVWLGAEPKGEIACRL